MKIAILNESFLKKEHLAKLRQLGEVVVYDDTRDEATAIERLKGIDVAVADCWLTPLNETVFRQAPQLKYVTLNSTGYDQVNLKAAKEHNIAIANVPGFSTEGVAEHTIALLFAITRHIPRADTAMRQQPFQVDPADVENMIYLGTDLRGKTMGIVGLGQIGSRVAELARGLGMNVIAYNRTPRSAPGMEMVTLDELLAQSDVVSLNTAFGEGLANLIDGDALQKMKSSAYLINTARGGLVNDKALTYALQNKVIAGAGLDVLSDWSKDNPLLALDNVVLTPHIAYLTNESLDNMARVIVENIEGFAKGGQPNVVN
jgi:lactate dehydrogenase-like 2-hydroxyacid dehydrogenase